VLPGPAALGGRPCVLVRRAGLAADIASPTASP